MPIHNHLGKPPLTFICYETVMETVEDVWYGLWEGGGEGEGVGGAS